MPTRKPSLQPRSRQNTVAAAIPAHPQFRMRLLTLAVLSACASSSLAAPNHAAAPANPLPTGGVVADPTTASIVNSAPNLMQINQTAAQTTIHWNSFDIGRGYTVRFNQPSSSAEAMNYIGGANPSVIQGTLSANGKVYLVNFWATSCPGCVKEMPDLIETYNQYKGRGFEVVAVAMSYDPPNYVANFAKTRQLPFPVALDVNGEHARAFGNVQLTPTSFIIDKDGHILEQKLGDLDFAKLKALLDKELT